MVNSKEELQKIDAIVGDKVVVIPLLPFFTNVFFLKGNNGKYVMVDCGSEGEHDKIMEEMQKRMNITPNDLSLILITHAHFDHAGGASYFKKNFPHIPMAVPELEAEYLKTGEIYPSTPQSIAGRILKVRGDRKQVPPFQPDILLKGGESLESYGVDATVIHTPGHTIGGMTVVVHIEKGGPKVAIINDLMGGGFVKYGKPAYHFFFEDKEKILKHIHNFVHQEMIQVFYVTHGKAFTRERCAKWLSKQQ